MKNVIEYERLTIREGGSLNFERVDVSEVTRYSHIQHFHEMHEIVLFDHVWKILN